VNESFFGNCQNVRIFLIEITTPFSWPRSNQHEHSSFKSRCSSDTYNVDDNYAIPAQLTEMPNIQRTCRGLSWLQAMPQIETSVVVTDIRVDPALECRRRRSPDCSALALRSAVWLRTLRGRRGNDGPVAGRLLRRQCRSGTRRRGQVTCSFLRISPLPCSCIFFSVRGSVSWPTWCQSLKRLRSHGSEACDKRCLRTCNFSLGSLKWKTLCDAIFMNCSLFRKMCCFISFKTNTWSVACNAWPSKGSLQPSPSVSSGQGVRTY